MQLLSRRERGRSGLFTFVVGIIVGVLVMGLIAPRRHSVAVRETARGNQAGQADATDGAGAGDANATTGGASSGGASTNAGAAGAGGTGNASGARNSTGGGANAAGAGSGASKAPGSTLVIGIAYPDLTALKVLGAEYDNGNVPAQWDAILDRWRREKIVPINGHPVQFVYDKYNVLDLTDQRRSCSVLTDDRHSFIVVGVAYFAVGVDCTASEKHVPTLTTDGPLDDVYQRGAPWLFSMQTSESRMLRNWIVWADKRGSIRGHRLGIYYEDDEPSQVAEVAIVKQALGKLGVTLAAEQTTAHAAANGGPQDAVAAQRFQAARVDVALLMTSKGGFMQQAKGMAYKPAYIESDHLFGTSDVTTAVYPADQFDGTYGMTGRRVGEPAGHIPEPPSIEDCLSNYERFTGTKLARTTSAGHESAEYGYILYSCDVSNVMLRGLQNAGATLTALGFVHAVEGIKNIPMNRYPNVSFGPGKHAGVDEQRTVVWRQNCTCWSALGAFEPLFVG